MVAMALAGFCDERNSLWRQFCQMTLKDLTDPYLRAMFAFLTSEDSYDLVLVCSIENSDSKLKNIHEFLILE